MDFSGEFDPHPHYGFHSIFFSTSPMSSSDHLPIPVPPEDRRRIHHRSGHAVVYHRGRVVVWGGGNTWGDHDEEGWDPEDVYYYDTSDHTWYYQRTTGELPRATNHTAAQVVADKLYVFGGFVVKRAASFDEDSNSSNDLHCLDLNNWRWTKLDPAGKRPLKSRFMSSWLAGDCIFIFGGLGLADEMRFVSNNDLAAYHTKRNEWFWPECSGQAPSPRFGHASFVDVNSNRAYVFGGGEGFSDKERRNDLHVLDMTNWTWQELMKSTKDKGEEGVTVPWRRLYHTLTLLQPSSSGGDAATALLYGGWYFNLSRVNDITMSDCWMLSLDPSAEPVYRWARCRHLEKAPRSSHGAVVAPNVGQLFLVGGNFNFSGNYRVDRVLKLPVAVPSLQQLAMTKLVEEDERMRATVNRLAPPIILAQFEAIRKLKLEEEKEEEKERISLEELDFESELEGEESESESEESELEGEESESENEESELEEEESESD